MVKLVFLFPFFVYRVETSLPAMWLGGITCLGTARRDGRGAYGVGDFFSVLLFYRVSARCYGYREQCGQKHQTSGVAYVLCRTAMRNTRTRRRELGAWRREGANRRRVQGLRRVAENC